MRNSERRLPHAAVLQLMQRRFAPCVDWTLGMAGRRRQRRFFFDPLDNLHTATAIVLLLSVFLSSYLCATTYYVAKTGSDTNSGSEARPWLTVTRACTTLTAGDTCWVKAGVYVDDTLWVDRNAGTAEAPIVYKSSDGWNTVLYGSILVMKPYNYIEDFRLLFDTTCGSTQVIRFYASNCAIRGCEVTVPIAHSTNAVGISNTRQSGDDTIHGIIIDRNTVHGFGYDNRANGIYAKGRGGTITNNIVYDTRGGCIGLYDEGDSVNYYEVAYNTCYGSIEHWGILVNGHHNWIHHNVCYGCTLDCGIRLYQEPCTHDNEISNNVVFDNVYGLSQLGTGANLWRNNIVFNNWRCLFVEDSTAAITLDYNCYYPDGYASFVWGAGGARSFEEYRTASGQDSHGFALDPLFLDMTNHNFRPTSSSPCVDAGDPMTPPGFDFDHVPTPQGAAVDMGAYEYHTFARIDVRGEMPKPRFPEAPGRVPVEIKLTNVGEVPALPFGKTFAIAPSPLSGGFATVRYSLPENESATLTVYDVAGRRVLAQTTRGGAGTASLDLRKLKAGVYLVGVTTEGFSTTQKLVVER